MPIKIRQIDKKEDKPLEIPKRSNALQAGSISIESKTAYVKGIKKSEAK